MVDVEELESERSEAESSLLANDELAYKLDGGCAAHASKCEERQRLRAEEVVDSRGNIKFPNDDDNLELFTEAVELIQRAQVQNSILE